MNRKPMLVLGVALATLFFAFLALTARGDVFYDTVGDTTLEDFNAGALYHTGLTRSAAGGGDGDGEVRLLTMGIAGEWYTDTNATGLPGLFGHAAVQHNGYIYVIGGNNGVANIRHVYRSRIQTETHDLSNWTTTTPLPADVYTHGVYYHGAAVLNGYIYVVGGWDDSAADYFNTVCYAPINADGTVGNWNVTTPLPQRLIDGRVVAVNGRLYVLGGQKYTSPIALDTVYYATPITATGVITGWLSTTPLLRPTFGHMVAAWDDWIYVAGGTDGATFYPYVNYAAPLTATGAIAAGGWMTGTEMEHNLYGSAAVAVNGELFTTAGAINNNYNPDGYVGAALIDRDGGIVQWVRTEWVVPKRFYHATVTSDDGWIYVIGGSGGTGPIATGPGLINRGATAGEGRAYAPSGDFTSRIMDLGKNHVVTTLSWSTFISDTSAMTITMRYRYRPGGGTWSTWQGPYPSLALNGAVTTTIPISVTARELQYAAFLGTTMTDTTPVLNRVWFTYIRPNPDLVLTKSDGRGVARLGDVITYTLYYTNTGGGRAEQVYITETLPAHTMPYGENAGWRNMGDGRYRYDVGTVEPEQRGRVRFVVQVNAQVPDGTGSIYNQALIAGQPLDDNPNDNRAEVTTRLEWVDLRLSLSDGVTTARPGDTLTYTIAITNAGSVTATGGVVTLTIPAHTTSSGNPDWASAGGRQYTRSLDLAPGVTTLTFGVRVDDPVAPSVTWLEATAVVTDDGSYGPDPTPDDNTDSDVDALSWVDLVVHKTDGRDQVFRNQTLVYTITITNAGNAIITGTLYLTDTLPLNTTYVDQGYGWSGAGRTWTKSLPVILPPGGSTITHIAARTTATAPAGPLTNTVTAWTPGDLHPASSIAWDVDTLIADAPNLVVSISDGVTATQICQTQNYTIQYRNDGNQPATGIVLTATLPAGVTYVGTGWQSIGGGRYIYPRPNLGPGGSSSVTLSTVFTKPVSLSLILGRGADRASSIDQANRSPSDWPYEIVQPVRIGCAGPENPEGNEAMDENVVRRPDLYVVQITYIPSEPVVGQPVTFQAIIGNRGDAPVFNACGRDLNVDLYVDPPHKPEAGEYSNVDVYGGGVDVPAHGTVSISLVYTFLSAGTHTVYVQANADRYWEIPETDFTNNTSDPLVVIVKGSDGPPKIYLPLIVKSFRP